MLNLPNVTLLCVETRDPELAHWAMDKCLQGASFGKVVLITNLELVKNKRADIEYIQAPPIRSTKDYSDLLLTGMESYVQGTHVLIIQWDSFITHPNLWRNEFLDYDYIGPVWPHHPETPVGNGGFSLRSVKLLRAIKRPGFIKKHPEDYCICADNKAFLEKECGIEFAPTHIAEQFAVERTEWHDAFGFHGFFNFGRVLSDEDLRSFIAIAPQSYFSGLDTFDLVANLIMLNRIDTAKKLANAFQFSWKMRKQYLQLNFWLIASGMKHNFFK